MLQELRNARLLKYYESEKTELEKQIKSAERDLKLVKGTIGKTSRETKISECKYKLDYLYSKRNILDAKIKKLKYGVYN